MTHKCCSSADIGFIEEDIFENNFGKIFLEDFGEDFWFWREKNIWIYPYKETAGKSWKGRGRHQNWFWKKKKLNLELCPKQMEVGKSHLKPTDFMKI